MALKGADSLAHASFRSFGNVFHQREELGFWPCFLEGLDGALDLVGVYETDPHTGQVSTVWWFTSLCLPFQSWVWVARPTYYCAGACHSHPALGYAQSFFTRLVYSHFDSPEGICRHHHQVIIHIQKGTVQGQQPCSWKLLNRTLIVSGDVFQDADHVSAKPEETDMKEWFLNIRTEDTQSADVTRILMGKQLGGSGLRKDTPQRGGHLLNTNCI